MKILILTQKVDKQDPILGFFHRWLEEFAKKFGFVTVICLEKGEYNLPTNVKVLSLGKENLETKFPLGNLVSKLLYVVHFYQYIWQERKNYDVVFVHMNQEYVLLGWKLWKLWGKNIFLWRNHAKGNLWTRLAIVLSDRVFYTSPSSFTAKFKNAVQMPVGIDTDFFKPDDNIRRVPDSILFLGRIAPVKRVLEFIDWLYKLHKTNSKFVVTIAGEALSRDLDYENKVKEKIRSCGLVDKIKFVGAVNQNQALELYRSHEVYVNMTLAGSMDKTILEAAACETSIRVENRDLKFLESKKEAELRNFVVENHSLKILMARLSQFLHI